MIGRIAHMEIRRFLVTPGFWVISALLQAGLAWLFFVHLDQFVTLQPQLADAPGAPGVTDLVVAPTLLDAAALLLLVSPLLAMRSLSEERKTGSLLLLQAAPVSDARILWGKFLGLAGMMLVPAVLVILMTATLALGTSLDTGRLATSALGLVLTIALAAAAGVWISATTRHPPIAAAVLYGLFLFLWIAQNAANPTDSSINLVQWIALPTHLEPLMEGRIRLGDLGYFVVLTCGFLGLAWASLSNLRGKGS